jgi:hypothetical protein
MRQAIINMCFIFIAGVFFGHGARISQAANMDSNDYKIQFGTINIGGQKMNDPVDDTYNLSTSLGQTAAGQFNSEGYIVKAGFQYIYSKIPFTFSLSSTKADLGRLMPSTPSTASINLSVSYGSAGQYVVAAGEEGPLRNFEGYPIADALCDGGLNTCSSTLAKPWTSLSSYGFGYSMAGEDIPADFINTSYYRPFADLNAPANMATVMQSSNVTQNIPPTPNPSYTPAPVLTGTPRDITHQATMTFKANISPLQSSGSYSTIIHFLATPSF